MTSGGSHRVWHSLNHPPKEEVKSETEKINKQMQKKNDDHFSKEFAITQMRWY